MQRSIDEDEQAVGRFIREVAMTEVVWGIRTPHGFALLPSDSEYAHSAILFWSTEIEAAEGAAQFSQGGIAVGRQTFAGTQVVRGLYYQDGHPERIELFNFLYRWLANMPT